MLHVLHLASWYPENEASRNGVFILRQIECLWKTGFQMGLITTLAADSKDLRVSEHGKYTAFVASYHWGTNKIVQAIRNVLALKRAWKVYHSSNGLPQIVVVHVAWKAGLLALYLKFRYKIPFVLSEHWSGYMQAPKPYGDFLQRLGTRLIVKYAQCVVCPSELLAESMQEHGLKNKYVIIPNVVDTTVFHGKNRVAKGDFWLHVSNLASVKNFDKLLHIFAAFRVKFPESRLLVAGAFSTAEAKKKFDGPWDGVDLLGVLSPTELANLYGEAKGLLLPSEIETFSIVVPEAMACGCAVIANDLPAIRMHAPLGYLALIAGNSEKLWLQEMERFWLNPPVLEVQDVVHHPYKSEKVGELWQSILEANHVD